MSIQRGVILIKDNLLAKRNWSGSKKCPFCDLNETIQHLFFDCQHAKTIWRVVHVATGLTPPKLITHMLRNWLTGISKKERSLIFVGAATLMWVIWCTCNDLIFEKKKYLPHLCMLFWGERTGCNFGPCYSVRIQERLSVWRAKHWRSSSWISLPKIDEKTIIDFAFSFFESFVYS